MRLLNANAAIAAGVLGSQEPEHASIVKIADSSMRRIGVVSVRALLFPCGSLSREAALVGAFSRGHRLGEVCIQCGADFFEPNLVCFHLLVWADREGSPCVAEHESAGLHSGSTKRVQRRCQLSRFEIPFTDAPVGIQTILLIDSGAY